jgi:hypothetical protein
MTEFRKQFLLCKQDEVDGLIRMRSVKISSFHLYYHDELSFTEQKTESGHFILLGDLFSYSEPAVQNNEILFRIAAVKTKNELFEKVYPFYGEYVLIACINNELVIFNDPCAQNEIYYNNAFTCFASQIKLMQKVFDLEISSHPLINAYYSSEEFNQKKYFVLDTTPYERIMHLQPNHFLDVDFKSCERFFPLEKLKEKSIDDVAKLAAKMLKGYLEAIAYRSRNLKLPVTAGYDSRVLFLASLDLECQYFISQHEGMDKEHYDITIAKRITKLYNKPLLIQRDRDIEKEPINDCREKAIDFPRIPIIKNEFLENSILINGNISEIARNFYGDFKTTSARKLAFLNNYFDHPFVIKCYENWMKKNKKTIEDKGYHYLDIFYWEEKMGNWTAKAKTEAKASGYEMLSPYNSRMLLELMLTVDRKYRDNFNNVLYDKIIYYLSSDNKDIMNVPINPSPQRDRFLLLKRFGLFNTFQNLRFVKKRLFR